MLNPAGKPPVPRPPRLTLGSNRGLSTSMTQDLLLPDLETFFPAHEVASWDHATQDIFKNIAENYQELQTIGVEMAARLPDSDQTEEKKPYSPRSRE